MSDTVIKVENLSKLYHLGERQAGYKTLRESLTNSIISPLLRRYQKRQSSKIPTEKTEYNRRKDGNSESKIWALRDVSFKVKRGEVVGIIGRNGAGKSTLLKILAKITEPTIGRVELNGRVGSMLEVGTGFHPELTGRDNVYLYGAILGMDRHEVSRKYGAIVSFAEIQQFMETPVKRYSSGMYMRLAFSVAAHLDPEILLVDEVLAVGDQAFQSKCLGKIDEVAHAQGRAVVFVSHNMTSIQRLCSTCVYIDGGRIKQVGPVASVLRAYMAMPDGDEPMCILDQPRIDKSLGERVRFSECAVINAAADKRKMLMYGEPFKVVMKVTADSGMDGVSFGVRIDNAVGEAIVHSISELDDGLFKVRRGASILVSAAFKNLHLSPGTYWLTVSARSGSLGLDQVVQALKFHVLEAAYPGVMPHPGVWGYVIAPADWACEESPHD